MIFHDTGRCIKFWDVSLCEYIREECVGMDYSSSDFIYLLPILPILNIPIELSSNENTIVVVF